MSRTGVFIAALLLLAGGRAFAFQTPGAVQAKQLSAAAMAAQQAKKPSAAAAAGQHYNPVQQTPTVCIEGPDCAASNATASQANSAGNIETNAQNNLDNVAVNNAVNSVTNAAGDNGTEPKPTPPVINNFVPPVIDYPPPPPRNYFPLIFVGLVVLTILAGTAGFAVHRHNILVTTRGLLSLRTRLVQPSAPSDHPEMKFEWPPLSIRTRLEEGITDDG